MLSQIINKARSKSNKEFTRFFAVKVGDKVPINYIKDSKPILILEDKEYPEWVFHLDEKVVIEFLMNFTICFLRYKF